MFSRPLCLARRGPLGSFDKSKAGEFPHETPASVETSVSCTAADFERNCTLLRKLCRNSAQDAPSLIPCRLSKNVQKLCASPIFCAKIEKNLCAHNFHTILGSDDSEVPKMLLHKFTGQKVYLFASKHRKYQLVPLVNRRVVPGLSRLSKKLMCSKFMCLFLALSFAHFS